MKDKNEIKSTAHSKYRCQYHLVFAPKFRRKEIYGQLRKDIGEILRKLCEQKGVEIIEAEACPDHIHMLVSIPPYAESNLAELLRRLSTVAREAVVARLWSISPICESKTLQESDLAD